MFLTGFSFLVPFDLESKMRQVGYWTILRNVRLLYF